MIIGGILCGILFRRHDGRYSGSRTGQLGGREGLRVSVSSDDLLQYRNQRHRSKVVRAAETAITKSKDIRTIRAGVQVNNPAAIAFWNKMGYKIDSEPELLPDKTVAVKLKKVVRP